MNLFDYWDECFRMLGVRHAILPEERMGPVSASEEADALLAGATSIEALPEAAQAQLQHANERLHTLRSSWKQAVAESRALPPFQRLGEVFQLDEFELLLLGAALYAATDARHARLLRVVQGAQERAWPSLELIARALQTTPDLLQRQCSASTAMRARLLHWVPSPEPASAAVAGDLALRPHPLLLQPWPSVVFTEVSTDPWLQEAGCLVVHGEPISNAGQTLKERVGALPVIPAPAPTEAGITALQDTALEACMRGGVLWVDAWMAWAKSSGPAATLASLVEYPIPIAVRVSPGEAAPRAFGERPVLHMKAQAPDAQGRLAVWKEAMKGSRTPSRLLELVAKEYQLHEAEIFTVARNARAQARGERQRLDRNALQTEIRRLQQKSQGRLARVVHPARSWDDLVLPEQTLARLHAMSAWAKNQHTVFEDWGLRRFGPRDRGITALFSGPSGTGKTLAAEVLAHDLGCDLVHVDLATVVDKYIGETEKRLREVFASIRQGTGVLLFDEADALFGKRTEVRDSHDRYANLGISYLLQLLESFEGVAVLTTNLKQNIDAAFLRRLRFSVNFAVPNEEQRVALWDHFLTADFPREAIDSRALAQHFELTGASIRNVVMRAAFRAAEEEIAVSHPLLIRALREEFAQLESVLDDRAVLRFRDQVGAEEVAS